MDVHGAMVSQVQLFAEMKITSMAWSCEKFKMEEGEDDPGVTNAGKLCSLMMIVLKMLYFIFTCFLFFRPPIQFESKANGISC